MNEPEPKVMQKGVYRHTKSGKLYEVLGVALHTETNKQLVVYRPRYESSWQLFARPYTMFNDEITLNGERVPRFEKANE